MTKKLFILLITVIALLSCSSTAFAFEPYEGYTYDEWKTGIPSANGYEATEVYYGDADRTVRFSTPVDMSIDESGKIYVLDDSGSQVVILNQDASLFKAIKSFTSPDGEEYYLYNASGLTVRNNKIYIADGENMCVVVSDLNGKIEQLITKPENPVFPQEKEFHPFSVSVDKKGNIYVMATDIYQGAAVFTSDGVFKHFYGANTVTATVDVLLSRFWKSIMNSDQREQLSNYVPHSPNNMDITDDGFMYTATGRSDYGSSKISCKNPLGTDVWGSDDGLGDLEYATRKFTEYSTEFVDVAVAENGFVFALDSTKARVFAFSPDHELTFIFAGIGFQNGTFIRTDAIETYGDKVYVLDGDKASITVFSLTEYGEAVTSALLLYIDGKYDQSKAIWEDVLRMNGNEVNAYNGIGKALLYSGQPKDAIEYFKLAGNRNLESRAYELYRTDVLRNSIPILVVSVFVLALLVVVFVILRKSFKKNAKKERKARKPKSNSRIKEFALCLLKPTSTFEDIRYKKTGSTAISSFFIFMYFVVTLLERHFLAFRFNNYTVENTNILLIFISTVGLIAIAIITNWATTTLWDGKGSMRNIWIVFGYSLCPYVCGILIRIFLSHFLIISEMSIVNIIVIGCLIWTVLILWFGMLEIQEFTIKKNLLSFLCTALGVALVVVLCFLGILLVQELFTFLGTVFAEFIERLT